jgi:hypothetical protein
MPDQRSIVPDLHKKELSLKEISGNVVATVSPDALAYCTVAPSVHDAKCTHPNHQNMLDISRYSMEYRVAAHRPWDALFSRFVNFPIRKINFVEVDQNDGSLRVTIKFLKRSQKWLRGELKRPETVCQILLNQSRDTNSFTETSLLGISPFWAGAD